MYATISIKAGNAYSLYDNRSAVFIEHGLSKHGMWLSLGAASYVLSRLDDCTRNPVVFSSYNAQCTTYAVLSLNGVLLQE